MDITTSLQALSVLIEQTTITQQRTATIQRRAVLEVTTAKFLTIQLLRHRVLSC